MIRNPTRHLLTVLLLCVVLTTSACGTVATAPEVLMTNTPQSLAEENDGAVAALPTASSTPLPEPTQTATLLPTNTTEPIEEITVEVTAESVEAAISPTPDQFTILAQFGNAENGATLFQQEFETNQGPYACFTCHNVDNEVTKIGPGQYNIRDRAPERVPGQSGPQYIYTSITAPQAYIVPGFENVPVPMPSNYSDLLSDTQVYDLVAYLLTLHD